MINIEHINKTLNDLEILRNDLKEEEGIIISDTDYYIERLIERLEDIKKM